MNKPLKDWTLGEVQKYCKITQCVDCCIGLWCKNKDEVPSEWDLSEPPRWTEQDKEDARTIKRILPWANKVGRDYENALYVLNGFLLNEELLPSLRPGESTTLDEIIGGTE